MKKVILTGANGFIGKACLKALLDSNVEVFAVVRKENNLCEFINNEKVHIVKCDLRNYDKLCTLIHDRDIDVFYHLAWEGSYGNELKNEDLQTLNINYSYKALKIAKKMNVKKFIFAGTINELELMKLFNAERNTLRHALIYGISKLASDFYLKTIANREGISYNTAIIGSCFGPGDMSMRIHNTFISSILKNEKPKLIACETFHDWVYIDEIAKMFVAIGEKSVNLKNYYLGHNKLRKLKDILLEVRDILNPNFDFEFGTIDGDLFINYSMVDINSIYEDTDYRNDKNVDFKTQIINTANWLKYDRKIC